MSNLIPMPKETLNRCRNMALNLLLELSQKAADKFVMKLRASYSDSQVPAKISRINLYYYTYRFYHECRQDGDEWIVVMDETAKGYCFPSDYNWRFPIPNPSQYEILPVIDFTQQGDTPEVVQDCTLTVSSTAVTIVLTDPETFVEIRNLPCGVYSCNVIPTEDMAGMQYYPAYYNNYSDYVSRGMVQIDRNGALSGFSYKSLYNDVSPYQPIGYDFYCLTDKFTDGIVDVVGTRRHRIKLVFCWMEIAEVDTTAAHHFDDNYVYGYQRNPTTETTTNGYRISDVSVTGNRTFGVKIYEDNVYKGFVSTDPLRRWTHWYSMYDRTVIESGTKIVYIAAKPREVPYLQLGNYSEKVINCIMADGWILFGDCVRESAERGKGKAIIDCTGTKRIDMVPPVPTGEDGKISYRDDFAMLDIRFTNIVTPSKLDGGITYAKRIEVDFERNITSVSKSGYQVSLTYSLNTKAQTVFYNQQYNGIYQYPGNTINDTYEYTQTLTSRFSTREFYQSRNYYHDGHNLANGAPPTPETQTSDTMYTMCYYMTGMTLAEFDDYAQRLYNGSDIIEVDFENISEE